MAFALLCFARFMLAREGVICGYFRGANKQASPVVGASKRMGSILCWWLILLLFMGHRHIPAQCGFMSNFDMACAFALLIQTYHPGRYFCLHGISWCEWWHGYFRGGRKVVSWIMGHRHIASQPSKPALWILFILRWGPVDTFVCMGYHDANGGMDTFVVVVQVVQVVQRRKVVLWCKQRKQGTWLVFGFTYGRSILLLRKQARRKVVSSCMVGASSKQQTANSKQQTAK